MPRRRRSARTAATVLSALAALAVLVAASCTGADESSDGGVTIAIDLEFGQRWSAEGPAVDRGHFCPSGIRHIAEGTDPTTNEIVRVRAWFGILEDAITVRNSTEITFVVEHTYDDGSGSFVTTERWGPDELSVESGTGAYRAPTGGGELSFATVDYTTITQLWLYLNGTLEG